MKVERRIIHDIQQRFSLDNIVLGCFQFNFYDRRIFPALCDILPPPSRMLRGGELLGQRHQRVQITRAYRIPCAPGYLIYLSSLQKRDPERFCFQIDRSVMVPVMMCFTYRAVPFTDLQIFCFRIQISADMTFL